jgi:hypothetical protein
MSGGASTSSVRHAVARAFVNAQTIWSLAEFRHWDVVPHCHAYEANHNREINIFNLIKRSLPSLQRRSLSP